jgi:hypothetical protein
MLTTYRRILAVPGALLFSATGLVGRLPISMQGLGIVLLVVDATGSYAYAGAVAGATTRSTMPSDSMDSGRRATSPVALNSEAPGTDSTRR